MIVPTWDQIISNTTDFRLSYIGLMVCLLCRKEGYTHLTLQEVYEHVADDIFQITPK